MADHKQQKPAGDAFVGRHLLLDVQLRSIRGITEVPFVYNLMEGLSRLLDMTLVYPPIVARFPWAAAELEKFVANLDAEGMQSHTIGTMKQLINKRNTEEAGISGICVWLESHAAIHTWTADRFFSFDAYSCKEFNADKAIGFLLSHFDVETYNGLDIVRTINKPQQIRVLKSESVMAEAT